MQLKISKTQWEEIGNRTGWRREVTSQADMGAIRLLCQVLTNEPALLEAVVAKDPNLSKALYNAAMGNPTVKAKMTPQAPAAKPAASPAAQAAPADESTESLLRKI